MDTGTEVLSAGVLTMLLVEVVKFVWRKWIKKDVTYDFPPVFYALFVPISNALMPFGMLWLGLQAESPLLGLDLVVAVKYLIVIAISSLVTFLGYNVGIKPLKEYAKKKALTP